MARDVPVTPEPQGEGITSCLTPPGFNEGRDKGVTKGVALGCCRTACAGEQVICMPLRRLPLCPHEPSWKAEPGLVGSNSILSLGLLPAAEQAAMELLWHLPAKEQELLINCLHHLAPCSAFVLLTILSKSADVLQRTMLGCMAWLACDEASPLGCSARLCWSLPDR